MSENPYAAPPVTAAAVQQRLTAKGWAQFAGLATVFVAGLFLLWALPVAGLHHRDFVGIFCWRPL